MGLLVALLPRLQESRLRGHIAYFDLQVPKIHGEYEYHSHKLEHEPLGEYRVLGLWANIALS
jgi:hypothetical protein